LPSFFEHLQKARLRALGLTLAVFALTVPLTFTQPGHTLENMALDRCYQWRPAAPPPPELLIVGIDEPSFQEFRQAWPWPRRLHAQLIQRLAAAGARLIVLDLLFAEPTTPEDDRLFAEAIKKAGNVMLARTLEVVQDPYFARQILVQPLDSFRRSALAVALTMLTPDPDGILRHFRVRIGGQETMPAAVARNFRADLNLPADLSGLIHYSGPPRSIEIVSYYQVLDDEYPLPAARIQNRIILVGRTLEASAPPQLQADAFYTPFFAQAGHLMSGVEVHAHIIHSLVSGHRGRELPMPLRILLYLAVLALSGQLLARFSPLAGLGAMAGLNLLLGGVSFYLFMRWDFWVPPVLLSLGIALIYTANVVSEHLIETREKRWLRSAFERYVSQSVVESITSHPERLELGGEEVEATVLFADLVGFTTLSEGMAPKEVIRLLNEYFSAMTHVILAHHGTLDTYIGDALMAHWGTPLPLEDHALLACQAALEMQRLSRVMEKDWRNLGFPHLQARMGVHSGPVVAGNVGSRERFNYTVMGDTVNLASRLEGVNKQYGTEILLSEDAYRRVAGSFLVRELDQVRVKGRAHTVTIYELLCSLAADGVPAWLQAFAAGRSAYLERHFNQALAKFRKVLALKPDDVPSRLYLKRCQRYLKKPPPPDWRGVFVLESK
jgi:adenylate cyclase